MPGLPLKICAVLCLALIAACGGPVPPASGPPPAISATRLAEREADIRSLTAGIQALGSNIDPLEAARAARIAYEYTAQLRHEYRITDNAMLHNWKVNRGLRPRGLCWHWAEDIETRLKAEGFRTLDLHRAIANYDNFRLEHSTVIVSAQGASMYDGMVLDPWRQGGVLTWKTVRADTRYNWTPRLEVFEWKRARGELSTRYVQAAGG
ncbi:hypothetical protein JANAI62_32900 [Jannaschia pagri]|uniref:Lipoprotein n=1 Tax=Jannaschia pagri TaxID=2829797 RepID=A0ABQ4NQH5_9RHOB|nr:MULTISPECIES: hypothetical protein [unclassified Jannaschia]GIT92832.1 hypothetical protein JANAI61_32900 [Jannaschia sp. AI_61]GIT96667.1 hypothetical protein JANAI62_32900 [Jannaschia sp. AI_62]